MKKTYSTPAIATYSFEPETYLDTITMSGGKGQAPGGGGAAKERAFEEDNEAFNVTDGEGMASYGDLW